jgi:hypothetical protein
VFAQVHDLGRSWYPSRGRVLDLSVGFLETVLHQQVEIVTLIEHLAFDMRVMFSQKSDLAILLRHEFLAHCRDLDVHVVFRKIEVRSEETGWISVGVPFESKGIRFVQPIDCIEVKETGKLALAVVSELGELSR